MAEKETDNKEQGSKPAAKPAAKPTPVAPAKGPEFRRGEDGRMTSKPAPK